jgi:hypothetical protein
VVFEGFVANSEMLVPGIQNPSTKCPVSSQGEENAVNQNRTRNGSHIIQYIILCYMLCFCHRCQCEGNASHKGRVTSKVLHPPSLPQRIMV